MELILITLNNTFGIYNEKKTILLSFLLLYSCSTTPNNKVEYPRTEKGKVVDNYFGTEVADPYHWL